MTKEDFHKTTNQAEASHTPSQESTLVPAPSSEPFACPACGQMLAPSCRVCVACKHTIDVAEIPKPRVVPVAPPPPRKEPEPEPVRFSWSIFLVVLAIWVACVTVVQHFMNPLKGELVLGGVQVLCSFWVLYDALGKKLPKPHRWGIGTLLLWLLIFPWYLARRQHPYRPCPFVEGRVTPAARAVLFILLVVLLFLLFRQAPPH